jgi:phage-related minor tail protein
MAAIPPALTLRPAAPVDELERLRRRVDELRDEIGMDVVVLRSRLAETFDLRRQASKHPFVAAAVVLVGAAVAASVLAAVLRHARRAAPRVFPRRARC